MSYFRRVWLAGILLVVGLITGNAIAQANFLTQNTEFLPVEQAFQWVPSLRDQDIKIQWLIAPDYYLYRERTDVKAYTQQGQAVDSTVTFAANGIKKYDDFFERETEVYYGQSEIFVKVRATENPLWLAVETQGCADAGLCYPPEIKWFLADRNQQIITEESAPSFTNIAATNSVADADEMGVTTMTSSAIALVFALLGGMILNLMPCVFPVLSLKVFGFAGKPRAEVKTHAWLYCAGVIASFMVAGSVMLALRAAGDAVGWGFQLQQPWFVALLIYLFFILGLAFAGVVHIGQGLMGIGQAWLVGGGRRAAFFTGVLAVLVASPCSVPFMGVALGAALTQHWLVALGIFAALGLGLALPFLLLAYVPKLVEKLPAPGAWMQTLQQFFAFPLFATALWLVWVLGQQAGLWGAILIGSGCLVLVFAGWCWQQLGGTFGKAISVIFLAIAVLMPWQLTKQTIVSHAAAAELQPGLARAYSPALLAQLRAENKPVFVNLTAAWCITCLANEKIALHRKAVEQHMREQGIYYLVGDWTNRDSAITALLNQHQRSGVPLYLYYPAGVAEPVILPQVLTEQAVIDALH